MCKVLLQTAVRIAHNSTCKVQKNYSLQFPHKTPSCRRTWSVRTSLMMESVFALLGRLSISQTPLLSLHPELVCGEMKQRPTAGVGKLMFLWLTECVSVWVSEENAEEEREKEEGRSRDACAWWWVFLGEIKRGFQRRVGWATINRD